MISFLKYLVYAMIIYILFSFVPENRVCLTDLFLIITIIMTFNISYEYVEGMSNSYIENLNHIIK